MRECSFAGTFTALVTPFTQGIWNDYKVTTPRRYLPALITAGLAFAALAGALKATKWTGGATWASAPGSTVEGIGRSLLTDYLIPFEFSSILLLVVLVGAARLARGQVR